MNETMVRKYTYTATAALIAATVVAFLIRYRHDTSHHDTSHHGNSHHGNCHHGSCHHGSSHHGSSHHGTAKGVQ